MLFICIDPEVVACGLTTLGGIEAIMFVVPSTSLEKELRAFRVARKEFVYTVISCESVLLSSVSASLQVRTSANAEIEKSVDKAVRRFD